MTQIEAELASDMSQPLLCLVAILLPLALSGHWAPRQQQRRLPHGPIDAAVEGAQPHDVALWTSTLAAGLSRKDAAVGDLRR